MRLPTIMLWLGLTLAPACTITVTEKLVFPATRYDFAPWPEDIRRRDVAIPVAGDATLRGWFLEKPGARRVALYFYGNGQHLIAASPDLFSIAETLDASVLCVDYRGYGWSGGTPSVAHAGDDALAAFDRLQSLNAAKLPALVIGWSLGTGYATYVAAHRDAAALLLFAPFTSAKDVVAGQNDRLPWFADLLFSFKASPALQNDRSQPIDQIGRVTEPLLVVHGTRDPVIPYKLGKKLVHLAPSKTKHLCTLEGMDHGLSFSRVAALRHCVTDFLATAPGLGN